MTEKTKLLLIEDNPDDAVLIKRLLVPKLDLFELVHVDRLSAALEDLSKRDAGIILLDLSLPDSFGLNTLKRVYAAAGTAPIVVLTALEDEGLGAKAVQEGAQDYLVKGEITATLLARSLRYALQRKRAEEVLRRQNEFYQSLLKAHSDVGEGFLVFEKDKILQVNEAFCFISGYSERELKDLPSVLEIIVPEQRTILAERLDRRLRGENVPDHYETAIVSKAGNRRHLEVAVKRLQADNPNRIIAIVRDITEARRKLIREERTDAARTMLQVLAHEIYNPLTGILGNLELLESEELPFPVRDCLSDIRQCAEKILAALSALKNVDLSDPKLVGAVLSSQK